MHKSADEATRLEQAGVSVTDQLTSFLKAKRNQADSKSMKAIDLTGDVLDLMYAIRIKEKTYLRNHRDEDYRGMRESLAQLMRKFDELDKLSSDSGDRDQIRAARESALRYKQVAADLAADRQKLDQQLLPTMARLGDAALALCQEAASRAQVGVVGTQRATNTVLIIGMIICLLVGGAIAWYMGGRLSAPLAHLTSVAKGLAAGDLDQEITIQSRDELGELARGLVAAEAALKPGGLLVVVTFHSLEDRMVKRFMQVRSGNAPRANRYAPETEADTPRFERVTRKAIEASPEECTANPRARSARLRIARRLQAPAAYTDPADIGMPKIDLQKGGIL
jgi:HAMP domain-containing protein